MFATLDEAKKHIGASDDADDADILRLVQVASAYLARIGVEISDPVAEPVKQAALILVMQFYRSGERDFHIRSSGVEGVGTTDFHSPIVVNEATMRLVTLLTAPYREVHL